MILSEMTEDVDLSPFMARINYHRSAASNIKLHFITWLVRAVVRRTRRPESNQAAVIGIYWAGGVRPSRLS